MQNIISVNNLSYKGTENISSVSFDVPEGSIFCIFGPENSGKNTLLKLLSGSLYPSDGQILIKQEDGITVKTGVYIGCPGLYPNLSGFQNLEIRRKMLGVKDREISEKILEKAGLDLIKKGKVKNYSTGAIKKLGVLMTEIGDPELIILYEPFLGIDPGDFEIMKSFIREMNLTKKKTVIIASSVMEPLYNMFSRGIILYNGVKVSEGPEDKLKLFLNGHLSISVSDAEKTKALLESRGIYSYRTKNAFTVLLYERIDKKDEISEFLEANGVTVNEITVECDSINGYFRTVYGGDR